MSYLARPYPEQSRQLLIEPIRCRLDAAQRAEVGAWLEHWSLTAVFVP